MLTKVLVSSFALVGAITTGPEHSDRESARMQPPASWWRDHALHALQQPETKQPETKQPETSVCDSTQKNELVNKAKQAAKCDATYFEDLLKGDVEPNVVKICDCAQGMADPPDCLPVDGAPGSLSSIKSTMCDGKDFCSFDDDGPIKKYIRAMKSAFGHSYYEYKGQMCADHLMDILSGMDWMAAKNKNRFCRCILGYPFNRLGTTVPTCTLPGSSESLKDMADKCPDPNTWFWQDCQATPWQYGPCTTTGEWNAPEVKCGDGIKRAERKTMALAKDGGLGCSEGGIIDKMEPCNMAPCTN